MFDINLTKMSNSKLNKMVKETKDKLTTKTNLNAMYVGIVEDTNDPRGLGRIKVRIPALHGTSGNQAYYMPTKQIPWASPALLNGGTNDMGQYIVPIKGSQVMVTFELNSFNKPVYMGSVPSNTSGKTKYYNDNNAIYSGDNVDINTNDRIRDLSVSSSVPYKGPNRTRPQTHKEKMTTGKTVLYKSLKGSTVMIDDADGVENIIFMDANGQRLQLGNSSGNALPRRGSRMEPVRGASTYMSLANGQGDEIRIVKGNVNITTGNNESIDLSDGTILISNSNGDKIKIDDGEINVTTADGDSLSLENGEINVTTSNDESMSLGNDKVLLANSKGTISLNGENASISNGRGSIILNGNNASISNGSKTLNLTNAGVYIGGNRVWDDSYHPGV